MKAFLGPGHLDGMLDYYEVIFDHEEHTGDEEEASSETPHPLVFQESASLFILSLPQPLHPTAPQ
jgi:hypothetical protein